MQKALNWAFKAKIAAMKQNRPHSLLLDALLFAKFRAGLGGGLRAIISGGAPILQEVFEFLCASVTPNIVQGYGLTEVSSGLAVQELPAVDPTTVGPSTIGCVIKLRPVPGTNYDPRGECPSGELLVKGPCVFQGYHNLLETTEEVLKDGWFVTGDVIEITKGGQLRIIDRVKQLVKLSQGEYLSMTTLNEFYTMADVACFVYVYANSSYDRPVAVVFPKHDKIAQWQAKGINDVVQSDEVQREAIASLDRVFKERNMRGFERITHCLIDTIEPSIENGLLTPSMKPQYAALRKKYEPALLQLYQAKCAAK
jgi:long-chain acyl-CoA synthetase